MQLHETSSWFLIKVCIQKDYYSIYKTYIISSIRKESIRLFDDEEQEEE